MTAFIEHMTDPVDPGIFLKMTQVWMKAASVPLPVPDNPQPDRLYLADIPMNRGAMAVISELRKMNIEPRQAYLFRIAAMGDIFRESAYYKDFVQSDESDSGGTVVSEALLKAVAVARFARKGKWDYFLDKEDVLAQANQFAKDATEHE